MRLGDRITAATSAAGVRPCGGCKRRAETLNRMFGGAGAGGTGGSGPASHEIPRHLLASVLLGAGSLVLHRRLRPPA